MKLPFHYQFILAPIIIITLLICLVAYTLVQLSKINQENEVSRQWEILTDHIQTAIASANRLNNVIHELSLTQSLQENENFFSYLEQTGILTDNLYDPALLEQLPAELRQQINHREQLFREAERVDPIVVSKALDVLLPKLEYQYKIFAAQRRTAFIDNHRNLVVISSQMTTVLLSGLLFCILLASTLAIWGMKITQQRLKLLSQRAHAVVTDDNLLLPTPTNARDDLDELEICLANMSTRLLNVISMENILRGAENERRRIAMDMHDGVLADLTAVNRTLDCMPKQSLNVDSVSILRSDVDNIINNLRRIIDDLHPQILETLGLESALFSFLERHKSVAGFPNTHFEFDKGIETTLSIEQKLNLFRITTEVINNAIKHAHCDKLELCLRLVSRHLVLTVEDNGVGILDEFNKAGNTKGHGLTNILERAQLIGATIQWRPSRFSQGICFELKLHASNTLVAE